MTQGLQTAPDVGARVLRLRRRALKGRTMLLLAAAISIVVVFAAGYATGTHRGGRAGLVPTRTVALKGTSFAPGARAMLDVWHVRDGNVPMTLSVVGLPKLPQRIYYEVFLVRDSRPWGSCGTFYVERPARVLKLTLNSPYALRPSDSWIVTRVAPGREPGMTVLRPV